MGMRPARVFLPIFLTEKTDSKNILLSVKMLRALLEGLTLANVAYLEVFPETPSIYATNIIVKGHKLPYLFKGAKYMPEMKSEDWLTIPFIIANGGGDCEDLAAARAAELRRGGVKCHADIRIRWLANLGSWRAHAIVKFDDGSKRVEDPSARLGMPTGGLPEHWGRGR